MPDHTTTTPHPAGIRAFVARRPITAFLIMAFGIAYPVMGSVALAVHRAIPGGLLLDRLPFPPDEFAGLMLTMFALLPSALFVTWAADGRPGITGLFKRIAHWRFGIGWWLAVLAGLPVLTVVVTLILSGSLQSIDPVGLFWNQLRLGILIAMVVLIAALALVAGRRRLSRAYRLELDTNPAGPPPDDTSSANR